jgi:hypothetical protein
VVIGLKFFMWPLGVWLVAIGRARAAALALAISAAFNAPIPPPRFGVFRM